MRRIRTVSDFKKLNWSQIKLITVPTLSLLVFLILCSPSLTIPTVRHFWKRQNWHRFRLFLSTGQSLLARQTYLEFFWTVRCKKKKRGVRVNLTGDVIQICLQTSHMLLP